MSVSASPGIGVSAESVSISYGHGVDRVHAVDDVSFDVRPGSTVGIVGESGSGKSTLARAIVGAKSITAGRILVSGVDITQLSRTEMNQVRRRVQLVPQDPYSSLNPRRTIAEAMAEAIDPVRQGVTRHREEIAAALAEVSLPSDAMERYPHEFSGGQRQRIAIARALVIRPKLIIADEITSALDVSVQADVLALLARLREVHGFTTMFISHDLAVVQQICDDVIVLYRGKLVEHATAEELFSRPKEDYTKLLLTAAAESHRVVTA